MPIDGLVRAHALEHRQPVVQRVREHVGVGVAPGHELAVVPDAPSRSAIDIVVLRKQKGYFSLLEGEAGGEAALIRVQAPLLSHPPPKTSAQRRRPQRASAATRLGIDARIALALQPQAVLQLPELTVGVVRAPRAAGFGNEPETRGKLQQRQVADIAGELFVRVRMTEHEVLHDELDVDDAAAVVLDVEESARLGCPSSILPRMSTTAALQRLAHHAAAAARARAIVFESAPMRRRRRRSAPA